MKHASLLLVGAVALSGCLETTTPVFDATNAAPLGESEKFMAFVDFMDAAGATMGAEDDGDSPRELLENGAFGKDIGDMVLVQSPDEGKYTYMSVGILGDRAFTCFVMPDEEAGPVAEAYGVKIAEPDPNAAAMPGMQTLMIEGEPAKVAKFIEDQLKTAPLLCMAVAKEQAKAPL